MKSAGTFTVTVTLSAAASQDVTIPFTLSGSAVAGVDYSGVTVSPLVIAAGATSATITGTLLPDAGASPTLTFTLGTPINATLGAVTTDALTITEPAIVGGRGLTLFRTAGGAVGSITYILGSNPPVSETNQPSFTYNGQAGGDSMTVLFANGEPLVSGDIVFNGGTGPNTLTIDAAGLPVRTVPGAVTAGDPQTVTYSNVTTTNIDNAASVDAIAGPDTADRGALAGLSANARFVEALYLDELGRVGDTTNALDAGSWVNALNSGALTQAAVAAGVEQSLEAQDYLVRSWYVTFLGRQAQGGEEQGWVNLLQQGQTEEQVLSMILASQEFYTRAQTSSPRGAPTSVMCRRCTDYFWTGRASRTGSPPGWAACRLWDAKELALGFLAGPTGASSAWISSRDTTTRCCTARRTSRVSTIGCSPISTWGACASPSRPRPNSIPTGSPFGEVVTDSQWALGNRSRSPLLQRPAPETRMRWAGGQSARRPTYPA